MAMKLNGLNLKSLTDTHRSRGLPGMSGRRRAPAVGADYAGDVAIAVASHSPAIEPNFKFSGGLSGDEPWQEYAIDDRGGRANTGVRRCRRASVQGPWQLYTCNNKSLPRTINS
jgi:hypothetical protein